MTAQIRVRYELHLNDGLEGPRLLLTVITARVIRQPVILCTQEDEDQMLTGSHTRESIFCPTGHRRWPVRYLISSVQTSAHCLAVVGPMSVSGGAPRVGV